MAINGNRENPYLAFAPCCGQTVCLRCMKIDTDSNLAADSYASNREMSAIRSRRKRHLATYDHSMVDTSAGIVMRMTIERGVV